MIIRSLGQFFKLQHLIYNASMNNPNLATVFVAADVLLFLVVIWQSYRIMRLEKIRKEFFSSGVNKNFEQILVDQNRSLSQINKELKEQDRSISEILKENKDNFQKMGFIRYNPFDDSGGNVSFAIALLNAHDDGFVISSLHGREGTRVYAKAVKSGMSESKLTEEELKAIKNAK